MNQFSAPLMLANIAVHDHLEWIKERDQILRLLFESVENGNTVALHISSPLKGSFIATVDNIFIHDGEAIVLLKSFFDDDGVVSTRNLRLSDINAACPLVSRFRYPVLKDILLERGWFY